MNLAMLFRNNGYVQTQDGLDYESLELTLGEKMIPLQANTLVEHSPYCTCII